MKVSIVGITGYSGLELVKILNNHKNGTCFYSAPPRKWGRRLSRCLSLSDRCFVT